MDINPWIGAGSAVVVAAIAGYFSVKAARASKESNDTSKKLEEKIDKSPLDTLDQTIKRLNEQLKEQEIYWKAKFLSQEEFYESRLRAMERRHRDEVEALEADIKELEEKLAQLKRRLQEKKILIDTDDESSH